MVTDETYILECVLWNTSDLYKIHNHNEELISEVSLKPLRIISSTKRKGNKIEREKNYNFDFKGLTIRWVLQEIEI